MKDYTVIIGGKAGDGVQQAGLLIAGLLNSAGYYSYMYYDYPSLIRGGHNFAAVRACDRNISALKEAADILIALNEETVGLHKDKLKDDSMIIYDSGRVKSSKGKGVPLDEILKRIKAPPIMKNSCIIGAFARAAGLDKSVLKRTIKRNMKKQTELNLKAAEGGYEASGTILKIKKGGAKRLPILNGSEAAGLGLAEAGLEAYYAYPMTPSSGLLHFIAGISKDYGIKTVHAESEIAVMLMALGSVYAGRKTAVGTSGGGFCLMTEGFSLSGMAELPITVMLGQRPGPSTGLPTYTCQSELSFALYAGQGEFPRIIAAPGDSEEAFCWAQTVMSLSWKYQVPAILLTDKMLCESAHSFSVKNAGKPYLAKPDKPKSRKDYKRYLDTETGVSPMLAPGLKNVTVKVNSYEHDEYGLTTENADKTTAIQDKRLRKGKFLAEEIENNLTAVKVSGDKKSSRALVCWGSNKGPAEEVAEKLGLKVVRPLVLCPFPEKALKDALKGAKKIICVENNATGQLASLMKLHGIGPHKKVLKYDGRPFFLEELENKIKEVI